MTGSLSRKLAFLLANKKINVSDLIEVLTKYGLLSLLPIITKEVKKTGDNSLEWDTVFIESPFEINEASISRIKRIIGNDLAPHQITINKNLLAGFKARYKGRLYDGSAERIIKQFIK